MSEQPTSIKVQDMADDTGGRAFVNTNDLTGALRQAVEDSEATYALGCSPALFALSRALDAPDTARTGRPTMPPAGENAWNLCTKQSAGGPLRA
jgi:hypothetical protein